MEDFINAFSYEVKLEIANRYFGFRTRIESEIQDFLTRVQKADEEIIVKMRLDILRMQVLLDQEPLFTAFLSLTGLPEELTGERCSRQDSPDSIELFGGMQGEGFTRWRRFRDLAFRVYLSLEDNIAAYREAFLDLSDEHEVICRQIDNFHRNNDLTGILSFLQTFDTAHAERLKFLHAQTYQPPDKNLDQDLRIAPPRPVDTLLPNIATIPSLRQVQKPLTELLETAFTFHRDSKREDLPF